MMKHSAAVASPAVLQTIHIADRQHKITTILPQLSRFRHKVCSIVFSFIS